jgi:hypothetical protein
MAQELIDKIRAAAQDKGVDPELALKIARAESALSTSAKAKTSTAGGLFQVTDSTWKQYGGKPGKKFDPDENIRVGLDIIASNQNQLKSALGRDPSASEVYAAHYFGPSGAKSFLSADPNAPMESVLGKAAIKANPNLQGKTVSQVMASLEGKVGSPKAPAVSRETPIQTEAEKVMEPALRSGMTALSELGPSYQAALALSVLSDTDEEKGSKDIDNEPSIAEKWLAESGTRPAALAGLSDISIKSPFPTEQPVQPQMLAGGGVVGSMDAPFASSMEPVTMYADGGAVDANEHNRQVLARLQSGQFVPIRPAAAPSLSSFFQRWKTFLTRPPAPAVSAPATPVLPVVAASDPLEHNRQVLERLRTGKFIPAPVTPAAPVDTLPEAPSFLAEGGEVSTAAQMLRSIVPMDVRTFGSTLLGNREPITEGNFSQEELAAMQQAVDKAVQRTGRPQKGTVQYQDYPRGEEIGPGFQPVGQTLGRFSYEKSPTGETVITDKYDFYNEGRKGNVEAYEKMGKGEKALTVSGRMLKNLVTLDPRAAMNELGDAYIGRDGREVRIKLPVKRADGSPETGEQADLTRPATFNPKIARQGEAARRLAAMRDVNTLPDPRTYAAVSGFLGTPPDEQGFSVMHPDYAGIKSAGQAGFYAGTATQVAPVVGSAAKMLGKLTGSALNERMLAGQSLTPGFDTPAPINFAVKPKGGTVLYVTPPGSEHLPISKFDELMADYRKVAARDQTAPDELVEFIKAKAPRYFTTVYGTADDPLRTAIRERAIDPFGRDLSKIPPYLVDAAKFPQARGHLQAKQELERMYDEMTGVRATALAPEDVLGPSSRELREGIKSKMAAEGVPAEAQNAPSVDRFTRAEFEEYPSSTSMLQRLVNNEAAMPSNVQYALRSGEVMYDISPNMDLLRPENVVDALKQVPVDKLKSMSFPEALIEGTRALAPIRDYRTAIEMADRGAKIPPTVLQQFTKPVTPGIEGNWVQITDPVATELEGKLMKHSVGGYSSGDSYGTGYTGLPYGGKLAFEDGLVRVYSLRDKQGMPTITVEAAKKPGSETWDVTQIRGRFNSEPANKADVFNLLDKIDETEGLGRIKPNSYSRSATGADTEGTMVDWGREYDMWKQGLSE